MSHHSHKHGNASAVATVSFRMPAGEKLQKLLETLEAADPIVSDQNMEIQIHQLANLGDDNWELVIAANSAKFHSYWGTSLVQSLFNNFIPADAIINLRGNVSNELVDTIKEASLKQPMSVPKGIYGWVRGMSDVIQAVTQEEERKAQQDPGHYINCSRSKTGNCDCETRIKAHQTRLIALSAKSLGDEKKALQAAQKKEDAEMDM